MNVYMSPDLETANKSEGGISSIIRAYHKYLPSHGVQFVDDLDNADVQVVHAGMFKERKADVPIVAICHGLHWTSDYDAKLWEWETNRDVVNVLRYAKEIVVPSDWVAQTIRRDMRVNPYVLGHGVDWADWQHQEPNQGYVIWAKNRNTDVCDPTPVNVLAKMFPKRLFLTTFSGNDPTPNIKVTGVMPYGDAKRAVQRSGLYLATTKETFGIGILEAMAGGKPILGFAHGGVLDLVEHGETGYLAKPGDYNDLATGLSYCFRHAKRLGDAARDTAKQRTWLNVSQELVDILHKSIHPDPPTVSVVIPVYNKSATLESTVESVLNQTYPPDEVIIVDNNSTDGSVDIASQLALNHGISFLTETRQGVAYARNTGIENATGKYIVCLDADDQIEPTFIETCKASLEADPSLALAYTSLRWVGLDGSTGISDWPGEYSFDEFLRGRNQVPTACMYRREVWARLGGYRQRYAPRGAGAEDAEFWFRMGAYGMGARKVSEDPLFVYSAGVGVTSLDNYVEPNWRSWHPWVRDSQHPFASLATPARRKPSHPVRQYDNPLISVIIPVAESHLNYLVDALDSLEAQTFRKWEAIVVCDGFSTPEELYRAYPYARWIEITQRGAGAARNEGVKVSKAPYLLFLDADDWLEPEALGSFITFQQGAKSIVYGDYIGHSFVDSEFANQAKQDGRLLDYDENTKHARIQYYAANYDRQRAIAQPDQMGNHYNWNLVTSLVPVSWHDCIGGFDEKMESWEDWDYFIRMAKCGYPFLRVQASLVNYRFHTGERREIGLANHEQIEQYMRDKYETEKDNMCCGGSSTSQVVQHLPPPPVTMNMGAMANMNGNDWLMVELADGRQGDHRVSGPITKTDYGYRAHGDRFLMHMQDVNAILNSPKLRLQVKVLTLEEEPQVEIEEENPPISEIEIHDGVPSVTSLKDIQSRTISLLEQSGLQTVKDVIELGEEGLIAIKGIGPVLAQRILESANQALEEAE